VKNFGPILVLAFLALALSFLLPSVTADDDAIEIGAGEWMEIEFDFEIDTGREEMILVLDLVYPGGWDGYIREKDKIVTTNKRWLIGHATAYVDIWARVRPAEHALAEEYNISIKWSARDSELEKGRVTKSVRVLPTSWLEIRKRQISLRKGGVEEVEMELRSNNHVTDDLIITYPEFLEVNVDHASETWIEIIDDKEKSTLTLKDVTVKSESPVELKIKIKGLDFGDGQIRLSSVHFFEIVDVEVDKPKFQVGLWSIAAMCIVIVALAITVLAIIARRRAS